MLNHSSFEPHPSGQRGQKFLADPVFTDLFSNGVGLAFLVRSLHGEVGHHRLFPIFVDHMTSDMGRDGATRAKPLRTNPVRKSVRTQRRFHVGLDVVNLFHGLVVGHGRTIGVAATSHDDRKPIAAMVSETDFLMGSAKHFNLHIREVDLDTLFIGASMTKSCDVNGSLVLGASEENTVSWDFQFGRQLIAKSVGLPVGQGDFCDGESTPIVKVHLSGDFFHGSRSLEP